MKLKAYECCNRILKPLKALENWHFEGDLVSLVCSSKVIEPLNKKMIHVSSMPLAAKTKSRFVRIYEENPAVPVLPALKCSSYFKTHKHCVQSFVIVMTIVVYFHSKVVKKNPENDAFGHRKAIKRGWSLML